MIINEQSLIWHNGKFKKNNELNLAVSNLSLNYGLAAFEGIRCYNNHIVKSAEHYERLIYSAAKLNIEVDYSIEELVKATEELITKLNFENCYIRPIVWLEAENLKVGHTGQAQIAIMAWSPATFNKPSSQRALNLTVSQHIRQPSYFNDTKCSNIYASLHLAKQEAEAANYDDALLLDYKNNIAECTTSNIFFVKDDYLYTAKSECALNGITKQTIIELAHKNGIEVIETELKIDQLKDFSGGFLTGTASGVREIASIDSKQKKYIFKTTEIFKLLNDEYHKLVKYKK